MAAAAAGGDERAVGVIFERYHEPLYGYCVALLRDPEQATQALQKTMLAAIGGPHADERAISLRARLYQLAREESLALIEARDPRRSRGANGLAARVAALPEPKRSALLFRELGGLEYAEIADALDIGPNAARQAVLNGRRMLGSAGPDRTPTCAATRTEMSANEQRFQRRADIREHLATCPECSAFAAALADRPPELQSLLALPAGVAGAVLGAGHAAIGDDPSEDAERRSHRVLVGFLLLGVALGSAAALAALGTFDSGGRHGDRHAGGGPGAVSVQVAPAHTRPAKPARKGKPPSRHAGGAAGPTPAPPSSPVARRSPSPSGGVLSSGVSAYTTPGERTEGMLGAP